MNEPILAFVESACEAFRLRGPVYRFRPADYADLIGATQLRDCFPEAAYVEHEWTEDDAWSVPDGAARTVLCLGGLEHVYRPDRAVEEMLRALEPGGVLLLHWNVIDELIGPQSAPGQTDSPPAPPAHTTRPARD